MRAIGWGSCSCFWWVFWGCWSFRCGCWWVWLLWRWLNRNEGTVFEVFGAVGEFVDFVCDLREHVFEFSGSLADDFSLFFFPFDFLLCTFILIDKFFILIPEIPVLVLYQIYVILIPLHSVIFFLLEMFGGFSQHIDFHLELSDLVDVHLVSRFVIDQLRVLLGYFALQLRQFLPQLCILGTELVDFSALS